MSETYDLVVLGAGSGGLAASKRAASYGARVAIVEGAEVGGTCVIRGCVPKKLLVYASQFAQKIQDASGYGWNVDAPELQWQVLRDNVQNEVNRLRLLHESFLEKKKVELFRSNGRLTGAHEITLDDGRILKGEKILIAVGGRPSLPPVTGLGHAIVSDQMFLLESMPQRFAVLGGGYIGLEFASMMCGFGVQTDVIIRKSHVLHGFDQEVREILQDALAKRGVNFITGEQVERIEHTPQGARIITASGQHEGYDQILAALGRTPKTAGIGLEEQGIELEGASIKVNDDYQTSVNHIFSVGDCSSRYALTPVAIAEGRAFADYQFAGKQTPVSYDLVATAVFTTPEVGTVGMTEEQALNAYGNDGLVVYKTNFRPMYETLAGGMSRYFMKILVQKETDRVVGVHIIGEAAAEMIQCVGIALEAGATKAQFDRTMALHPSAAEELVTLYTPES